MNDQEYFDRLAELAAQGSVKSREGRRTLGVRYQIRGCVAAHERLSDVMRHFAERAAQAVAIAGYLGAAALATITLTTSVECAVSDLPAWTWQRFALAAVVSLVAGIVGHTVYDEVIE